MPEPEEPKYCESRNSCRGQKINAGRADDADGLDWIDVAELTILLEKQFTEGDVTDENDQIEFCW